MNLKMKYIPADELRKVSPEDVAAYTIMSLSTHQTRTVLKQMIFETSHVPDNLRQQVNSTIAYLKKKFAEQMAGRNKLLDRLEAEGVKLEIESE